LSAVILHRGSLTINPYHEWLADYEGDLFLVASQEYLDDFGEKLPDPGDGYRHAEAFRGFDKPEPVNGFVSDLVRQHGASHIIACQELVLQRAAELRQTLGLPGQTPQSALAFRDKLLMKKHAVQGGVAVAQHHAAHNEEDVRAFADEHGFPIVLKPRDGAGSIDARVIRSKADLEAVLGSSDGLHFPNMLVESYIPGHMYHVNGVVVDGRTVLSWPSRYFNVLAEFKTGVSRTDVTLEPADPLTARLVDFNERVLAALPGPAHFGFHTEIFHTPDDRLVLCEIASRTGGAAVKEIIRAAFDVDLTRVMVRAQLGLSLGGLLECPRPDPSMMAGQLLLMKRPGIVRSLPDGPHFPWVHHYRMLVEPGQRLRASNASSDMLACMVIVGPDRATCEARLREARAYFDDAVVIDPAE
jgi:biotin carboxylase